MAEIHLTGNVDRDLAALELNTAIELVLESVAATNGDTAVASPAVQDFVRASQRMAAALGWVTVGPRPDPYEGV